MTKNLKDFFSKTAYGYEDTRSIIPNINLWFKENNIKAKAKKESKGNIHYGGKVTGGDVKTININIQTKERFDLKKFINEFECCEFRYNISGSMFQQHYAFNLSLNGKMPFYNTSIGNTLGKKFRDGIITEDMVWDNALKDLQYHETFKKYIQ